MLIDFICEANEPSLIVNCETGYFQDLHPTLDDIVTLITCQINGIENEH